ncbi:MAG: MATE family efflux transporter [Pseudomonadota bacterium]
MKNSRWPRLQAESSLLLKLAMPILLAQWALTGLGVIDTLMSGWVGTNDLAAIGLGSSIMFPVFMFSTGILLAITPLVAKANGQVQNRKITEFLYQGLWLALPLGLVSLWGLMNLDWLLNLLDLNSSIYQLSQDYLFYIAFGLPAIALYQALRFFWEGLGTTLPTMWISFFALLLNVPLNALFIYGMGPIEPLGAAGCGIASTIVMWGMLLVAVLYVVNAKLTRPFCKPAIALHVPLRPSWKSGIKPILALGVPNTLALLFEVSLFSMIVLFIASLGAEVIAGNQIALSFTSMAFMVPLSLAMALTVRVGDGFGRHNREQIRISLVIGFTLALLIGLLLALISYFFRFEIVALYTDNASVVYIASSLLIFAAIYQVFDAIQVTAAGALRGFHDTQVTMFVTFVTYWGVGLGLGYLFAFKDWIVQPMGVQGFWLGIVLGLMMAAILLSIRLKKIYHVHFA